MDRAKLTKVANTLMLEVNSEVLDQLEQEYELLETKINRLKKVDVSGINPLVWIGQTCHFNLRVDEPNHQIDREICLKNAPSQQNGLVSLKKVL
ncbi:hypothetical protein [Mycoplasma sp. ATU-Cv-703]|uniref:hypothetical protein n=1 Tax=Mycoplasma sp. ATU-Cv-703 TaxID=2498595 RepID=UPI000FDE73F7